MFFSFYNKIECVCVCVCARVTNNTKMFLFHFSIDCFFKYLYN